MTRYWGGIRHLLNLCNSKNIGGSVCMGLVPPGGHRPTGESLDVSVFLFARSKTLFIKHTGSVHLVGFSPANTFASEYMFSHAERTCHVRFDFIARSSTVINTLADKLLLILLENTDNNTTT